MQVVTWILTGLVAGGLVGRALRAKGYGLLGSLVVGSAGGVVGGWFFRHILQVPDTVSIGRQFLASLVGSVLCVVAVRAIDRAARGYADPAGAGGESRDLEAVIRRLGSFEQKVLSHVLTRRPVTINPETEFERQLTFGQRVADQVATFGGSWTFIGLFGLGLAIWMLINSRESQPFDPYPFILLNLLLSCVAALQAPVIMMSQNRQTAKDRLDAQNDYKVNLNAEVQILGLHAKFDAMLSEHLLRLEEMQRKQIEILEQLRNRADGGDPSPMA